MSIVQVIIDRTTSMIIEGIYEFDRTDGGTLVAPSGASFPTSPVAGEWFWRTDEVKLYRRNDGDTAWEEVTGAGISETQHKTLRQLIHFIDGGPAEGFASGAYRETTGTVFPTAIIWYDQVGVGKKKIVSKEIGWSGAFPTTITWKVYDASEILLATVVDTITYSGPFETSRTRTIS
jgi:hypothetical protein